MSLDSHETPSGPRRYRTPIGTLTVIARGRRGELTLTIAAGRARGTHTDESIDARGLMATLREHRATCDDLMDRYHLAQITVFAPASHGGFTVEVIDGDTDE